MMNFDIKATDTGSKARAGVLETDHGPIETPIFMPVGTLGTVKGIHQSELRDPIQAQIILGNTYHLYLRPGIDTIVQAGGLHKFINWDRPMLTDSGGYQIYSLSQRRKINHEGAVFRSHLDGSKHLFTPENVMDIQRSIGADIIMAFDECTPYPCEYKYAKRSLKLTHAWLDRCIERFDSTEDKYGYRQELAPIVQGSTYSDLRRASSEYIASKGRSINAIGGLSVGEPEDELYAMTEEVTAILPHDKPRYLMGVGTPANLLNCVERGIDMFDCVLPTRNARHGLLYTQKGIINIKNLKWKNDMSAIDADLDCPTSNQHTKSYLRHLFSAKEYLGMQLATLQNLTFYLWLMREARKHILNNTFSTWKVTMEKQIRTRL